MKKNFITIEYLEQGAIAFLKLNRPEKKNAINKEMISELIRLFEYLNGKDEIILLQIVGKGDVFSAGADLSWMQKSKNGNREEIMKEFFPLTKMLNLLYNLPQITVSMVHGAAYGGAIGLLSCSDFIISAPDTSFAFSEINLGLIPATISPYIVKKIGLRKAKELFFSGERFDENMAVAIGLVDQIAQGDPGVLNYETPVERILKQPHQALRKMKLLLRGIDGGTITANNPETGLGLLSDLILDTDTQKLLSRFLET